MADPMTNKRLLANLRKGVPPHKNIHIGDKDGGLDICVVIVSADKCLEMEEATQQYCTATPTKVNDAVRNQVYNAMLCANCMRDPENIDIPIADTFAEVLESMDLADINAVVTAYGELMLNKAPKLEMLTDEQLDIVKKHLEATPLSDLSTVLLVHLVNCHRTIVSEK